MVCIQKRLTCCASADGVYTACLVFRLHHLDVSCAGILLDTCSTYLQLANNNTAYIMTLVLDRLSTVSLKQSVSGLTSPLVVGGTRRQSIACAEACTSHQVLSSPLEYHEACKVLGDACAFPQQPCQIIPAILATSQHHDRSARRCGHQGY